MAEMAGVRIRGPAAPAWATPAGPPTAAPPTATRTRTATPPARSPSSTTASSRTSRPCATSWRRPGVEFASDTDTEVAVHLVAQAYRHGETAGDFAGSVLAVLRRLEGHFTLVFANADEPGTIVAARRSTPLVLGIGDGEMFVGSDVAAFIEHTRHAVELGQDQAVVITADGYRITDFDGNDGASSTASFTSTGTWPPPKRAATSTSCSRRSPSSPPRWPTRCSAISSTAGSCWTSSGYPTRNCARSTRCSWSPAAPPTTPGCSRNTRSSTGRGCRWKWSSPANSATGTRCWTAAPWWWPSRSPGKPPTPWKRSGTPRSRRPRCWRSATPTARRSRASAMRCCTPAPARRSAWPRRRPSWPRSPPTTCSAWRWRRPAAPSTPTRWSASTASWKRCRTWWRG